MSVQIRGADMEIIKFSAGETHVKITDIEAEEDLYIFWDFENFEEFMQVAMIADVGQRNGSHVVLYLDYVPFTRQDRATTKEQPFSLEIFCRLLKTLTIDEMYVCDPHSDVFGDLIEDCVFDCWIKSQKECFIDTVYEPFLNGYECVISPDNGAKVKSKQIAKHLKVPLICATKVRDPLTGQLSSPTIDFGDLKPKRALIPDDILDFGGTFLQLADEIKKQFPDIILDLYITHGIFAAGREELNKRFKNIYCYNDMSKQNKNV